MLEFTFHIYTIKTINKDRSKSEVLNPQRGNQVEGLLRTQAEKTLLVFNLKKWDSRMSVMDIFENKSKATVSLFSLAFSLPQLLANICLPEWSIWRPDGGAPKC